MERLGGPDSTRSRALAAFPCLGPKGVFYSVAADGVPWAANPFSQLQSDTGPILNLALPNHPYYRIASVTDIDWAEDYPVTFVVTRIPA